MASAPVTARSIAEEMKFDASTAKKALAWRLLKEGKPLSIVAPNNWDETSEVLIEEVIPHVRLGGSAQIISKGRDLEVYHAKKWREEFLKQIACIEIGIEFKITFDFLDPDIASHHNILSDLMADRTVKKFVIRANIFPASEETLEDMP